MEDFKHVQIQLHNERVKALSNEYNELCMNKFKLGGGGELNVVEQTKIVQAIESLSL